MNTAEAIERLASRHSTIQGKWAWLVEFCFIDFLAVGCQRSTDYAVHGYEIKVSRGDWLRELKKTGKADLGMARCDYWYLAAPRGVLKDGELPPKWGFVELGKNSARVKVRPTRLREKPPRDLVKTESGMFIQNPALLERETFASLARRFAYEQADKMALMGLGSEDERTAALDVAAHATNRLDSRLKEIVRRQGLEETQRKREVRFHNAHVEAGSEYSSECTYGWCQRASTYHPGLLR